MFARPLGPLAEVFFVFATEAVENELGMLTCLTHAEQEFKHNHVFDLRLRAEHLGVLLGDIRHDAMVELGLLVRDKGDGLGTDV